MSETWIPETFQGQVCKEHHEFEEFEYHEVYLTLSYGANRIYLGAWAADLEDGSLIEVTGALKYIDDIGEFFITGPLDCSKPEGTDPMWREITVTELGGFIPGVNDPAFDEVPVMNMRCPVCRAEPGDSCSEVGYLVSHVPGEPHCHQARWDRATDAAVLDQSSDAVAALLGLEVQ